jgi:hypothetical protein
LGTADVLPATERDESVALVRFAPDLQLSGFLLLFPSAQAAADFAEAKTTDFTGSAGFHEETYAQPHAKA